MKWFIPCVLFSISCFPACSQSSKKEQDKKNEQPGIHTLLWKISGNGLQNPSYLYGTIHMICGSDAGLSANFKDAIAKSDAVYLEVDMDNLFEMLGALTALQMKGDTTLEDLYSPEEYQRVKKYFDNNNSLIPFDMLKQLKPMLASSLLDQKSMHCEDAVAIEQLIMEEAKKSRKSIKGLETLKYQASVLDSIPYKMQAQQLLAYIDSSNAGVESNGSMEMMEAYKEQDLKKLETLMMTAEPGMNVYYDILLYNRNRNWVRKLKDLLPQKSLVIAVGAGHLPGENGVINLLKKEGYEVTPVENKIVKTKEI